MNYIGVDLHKQTISVCVVIQEGRSRRVVERATLRCSETAAIVAWFERRAPFEAAVEATAAYEWFLQLIERSADRVVLVHPKKMRVIAESSCKTDRIDAWVLAEHLALDKLPAAYRPTPRQRQHRTLVRQRVFVQRRITGVKNKLRHILAGYNADRPSLFSEEGRRHLAEFPLSPADRFVVEQLLEELAQHQLRLRKVDRQLREFAKQAPTAEREAREVLATVPCVGPVTVDVVVSELGDVRRFRSAKQAAQYAGLAPGQRTSADRRHGLPITKEGSPLLRWAMVEAAWRLTSKSRRWGWVFEKLAQRMGKKKAIVAVARRLLCVLTALLRSGQKYRMSGEAVVLPGVPAGTAASSG